MYLDIDELSLPTRDQLLSEDKWLLDRYEDLVCQVTDNIEKFELGVAVAKLYDFIWDVFCDWYIELAKIRLSDNESSANLTAQKVISYVLSNTLKLLHPFMPFITEEIWLTLPHEGESIMVSDWPKADESLRFPEESAGMEKIIAAVKAIRNRRSEMNVPPSKKPHLIIVTDRTAVFEAGRVYLSKLAYAGELTIGSVPPDNTDGMVTVVTEEAKLYMPLAELVDLDKERERIGKELSKARDDLQKTEAKLQNESFVSKAPANVVNAERDRVEKTKALIENLTESLKALG
jgi:valyl-tRNA synthetase